MSEEIDQHVMTKYKVIKKIGSGAYGHVWKVTDRKSKGLKALKKNFDAFSNSTDAQRIYRQIMFLQQLKHTNIINLQKIIKANNDKDIYLIFQHMDVDLHTLIRQGNILQEKHKKYIIYQIAKALFYLHNSDIIHRDLKPSNILVNEECDAKLCDFGLVRLLQEPDDHEIAIMTDYIATRWYRAPQLLLGSHQYSKQIDIWSLGCMVGQIMKGKPLFPGKSTLDQLEKVLAWTGPPSTKDLKSLKTNISQNILDLLNSKKKINRAQMIPSMAHDPVFMDFISSMLEFDPSKRIQIQQILKHQYLSQFYKAHEIQQIKKAQVSLKLHINDNTKLSVKDYRNIIYKEIQKKSCLDRLKLTSNDIDINPIKKTSQTIRKLRTQASKGSEHEVKANQSRYPVLKQSKIMSNKRNSTKERSVSRKKGISLCSKEIQNYRKNENNKHHRSFIGNVNGSTNERYRCLADKDSSLSKKHTINQTRKKMSYDKYLVNYTKLKD